MNCETCGATRPINPTADVVLTRSDFMPCRTCAALAAAQAEVARLNEKRDELEAQLIHERNSLSVVGGRNLAAQAEIAALRRVLAECRGWASRIDRDSNADFVVEECFAALSASSAAEPLLADIRAAVDILSTAPACAAHGRTDCECCGLHNAERFAALTGLRRWVP